MAVIRVEKNKNYTVMANYHLRDKNLSCKAKGLLSMILSLPEDWNYSVRGLAAISKESVGGINSILKELEKTGYLTRTQPRDENGKMGQIVYTAYEEPRNMDEVDNDSPCIKKPHTVKPDAVKPDAEEPDTEICSQISKEEENKEKEMIDINNYPSNPIPSLNSFPLDGGDVDNSDQGKDRKGRDEKQSPYSFWEKQIMTNIGYESLMQSYPYDQKLINEIVSIMVETVISNRKMIRIAGDDYPFSVVKEKFLAIDYGHIQYIIDCFNEAARNTEIKNIKQYMKALIFNAPSTIDSYYTAMVRHDMPWLGQK